MRWSEYDDAVPHTSGLPAVAKRFDEIRRRRRALVGEHVTIGDVREVVVVAASSRGGSSLLGELLRRTPGLVHLRAETNPLFVVAGLDADRDKSAVLAEELAVDIGRPVSTLESDGDVDALAASIAWRLTAQWPDEEIDPDAVDRWVRAIVRDVGFPDRPAFHVRLLHEVRRHHPGVDPWYYDLPDDVVRSAFPDVPQPEGPPADALVEMPPFVLVGPWCAPDQDELARHPLVLSTPRNSFRLDFLAALFPHARLRLLHLVRNPAAAVNGLVDGWLHRGFFNCVAPRQLHISGYSDTFPRWGRRWWNYDYPPDWEDVSEAPLVDVAARQWSSTHEAALAYVDATGVDHHRLRFEDVVGPSERRERTLGELAEWLGLDPAATHAVAAERLPPVMATETPRPRRWEVRADAVLPVVSRGPMRELAERLGYHPDPATWE